MATSEALIKYYDCLKDSFNKIQVKDNKTALVNAALRPKIREEFVKSRDVLKSYLNYIQVFTLIYSDKFSNICSTIICPIFREVAPKRVFLEHDTESNNATSTDDSADQIHETMREIFKSKPELAEEFVHCVNKTFPTLFAQDEAFSTYLANCLEICTYLEGEPLANLVVKILDRINPSQPKESNEEFTADDRKIAIIKSYELLYKYLDETSDEAQLERVVEAILDSFAKEFLATEHEDQLNYLLLYVCSKKQDLAASFIDDLWAVFTSSDRPYEERKASVFFACSFLSRASFISLDKVYQFLESASSWCHELLIDITHSSTTSDHKSESLKNENHELFYDLAQSILYLITQRYREMYEKEALTKLINLDLGAILDNKLKPMDLCDTKILRRFQEVVTLLKLPNLKKVLAIKESPLKKRRKSDHESRKRSFKPPFEESDKSVPDRVKPFFRNYYDHRNFTVVRE